MLQSSFAFRIFAPMGKYGKNKGDFKPDNQHWRKRPFMGQKKRFETPDDLLKAALGYFKFCDQNPLTERQGDKVITKPRAYTWTGLEVYLGVSTLKHYKSNDEYSAFFPVCQYLDKIIRTQKFEYAAAGMFNANIIARDLGLVDKNDITSDGKPVTKNVIQFGDKKIEI